jgi:nucleoside-diphosphate-sugar epimerase
MKKVLITGGAGFIGLHLAKLLSSDDYHIDLVDNFARGVMDAELEVLKDATNVNFYDRDLLEENALVDLGDEYHFIFHLAAIIGVSHVLNRPFAVLDDNVKLLVNLLSFAKKQKSLNRFLFASTSEVYAGTLNYFTLPIPTPESSPLTIGELTQPRTSYMLSKIYGEALSIHSGLPITIFRPHNVYGPRMGLSHVVPELLKKAYALNDGDSLEVYSVNHKRAFCYIGDAVNTLKAIAESDNCESETINLGNQDQEISMGDLATIIKDVVGKNITIIPLPSTPGSPERRCPDMSKLFELTGYKSKITLEEGVQRTFAWYKKKVFDAGEISAK